MYYQNPYGYQQDFYGGFGFQSYYRPNDNRFAIALVLFILLVIVGCTKCKR